ncbi:MAG: glycoside hydrolase family 29 [Chitinophagaceae bacterium]|nr:MAG: glycoside hydrolase family 29 [Chitinophagaceae bacterium]
MKKIKILTIALSLFAGLSVAQKPSPPKPVYPIPSPQQLKWHEMELYAFIHFTTNTFTGKEWGYGDESPEIFNPSELDANQWAKTLKDAGFKAVILTTKHHDGFTLWPSKYTEHSIKNSPYKNGKGDIVKETSDAAKKYGLQFGVYLSPWDRNHADYGTEKYITYYRNQLKELFTNYGPIFEMWFDGANGGDGYYGGKRSSLKINGAKYYDWPNTLKLVRSIQPQVLFFSDAGPDIRWVGNERGIAGITNWNTISPDTLYAGKPDINELLNIGSSDGKKWIPAEVDVSIRPGWFYHEQEDKKVKTPEELFDIYLSSVGRGSNLLLNIPPDKRGLFHEKDVASLMGFKKLLSERLSKNLAFRASAKASNTRGNSKMYSASNLTDNNKNTYWATDDRVNSATVEINMGKEKNIQYILLQEHIALGQRIKSFAVDVWLNNQWKEVANATTMGYKRILKIEPSTCAKIRVRILDAKASPVINNIAVY